MRSLFFAMIVVFLSSCSHGPNPGIVNSAFCLGIPSTEHLLEIRNVDYNQISSVILNDPVNHMIDVCPDHFAANTPAGHQFISARGEINRIEGSAVHFTSRWTGVTHLDPMDMFPASPVASRFDYVDVSQPLPSNCNLATDLTFAMRTCRYDQSGGGLDHFNILVNSASYAHFTDPTSSNYPKRHGILHELAHAFGMNHTGSWDVNDRDYISTMQGNLEYLSALDVAFLRNQYPKVYSSHRNYVASSLTRFDGVKGRFDRQNPNSLYVDSNGYLKDCETNADPEFFVAWFNTGNWDGIASNCGKNRIYLRKKYNHNDIVLIRQWRFANMPYLSQDQWKGVVARSVANANINFNSQWELVFETNYTGDQPELTNEDNIVFMEVELFDGACS